MSATPLKMRLLPGIALPSACDVPATDSAKATMGVGFGTYVSQIRHKSRICFVK
jgi:hypothetical protein